MIEKTKKWGGVALPDYLNANEIVGHCLTCIKRECALVDVEADLVTARTLLEGFGVGTATTILSETLRSHNKLKEWWALRKRIDAVTKTTKEEYMNKECTKND